MKIYQIHKYGGEWEDRFDYIVSSYLSEDKAIAEKNRLEQEEKIRQMCNSCPLYFCEDECNEDCEECNKHTVEKTKAYCDRYKPFNEKKHECANRDFRFSDNSFRIEEVEVIE